MDTPNPNPTPLPDISLEDAIAAVFTKATSDADYRARCLADPVAALAEVAPGFETETRIVFGDREAGDLFFCLPAFLGDGTLSPAEGVNILHNLTCTGTPKGY